jgi:hypothetical protein
LTLRNMRNRLGDMIDTATICRVFEQEFGELAWSDLELLAAIEDLHRDNHPHEQDEDNGEGR